MRLRREERIRRQKLKEAKERKLRAEREKKRRTYLNNLLTKTLSAERKKLMSVIKKMRAQDAKRRQKEKAEDAKRRAARKKREDSYRS